MSARAAEPAPATAGENPEHPDHAERIASGSMIAATLASLEEEGVGWCLLRGEVEVSSPGDDVDLLVASGDLARVSTVLDRAGFLPLAADGRGSHIFFVRYSEDDDVWVKLDFVADISFGRYQELRTGAAEGVLARRHNAKGVWLAAPDDAFWMLLLHCLLDKGRVPPHHAARLQELAPAAEPDSDLARAAASSLPAGWDADRLIAAARRGDGQQLTALAPALRSRWRQQHPLTAWSRLVANAVLRKLKLSSFRRRGARVHLVGPASAAGPVAASLPADCPLPLKVLARSRFAVRYHLARGRLVVQLGPPPNERADSLTLDLLLVDVTTDISESRRRVNCQLWRRYAASVLAARG
jgi:hypothetical protein